VGDREAEAGVGGRFAAFCALQVRSPATLTACLACRMTASRWGPPVPEQSRSNPNGIVGSSRRRSEWLKTEHASARSGVGARRII
jgi:hypothetical protein